MLTNAFFNSLGITLILFYFSFGMARLFFPKISIDPFSEMRKKMGELQTVLFVCFTAPVLEEVLFRYVIQDIVMLQIPILLACHFEYYPLWDAVETHFYTIIRILFSTALFSVVHLNNAKLLGKSFAQTQVVTALFLGLILGIAAEHYGLIVPIMIHCFYNMLSYAQIRAIFSKEPAVLCSSDGKSDTTLHQMSLPPQ